MIITIVFTITEAMVVSIPILPTGTYEFNLNYGVKIVAKLLHYFLQVTPYITLYFPVTFSAVQPYVSMT